ncbi:V-set domain-containing T-cell activation inhibitor 1-like [Scomber scombrus]|uniref:V-set domain-containing T-cell activation inhibitor 1-like n=1 Tax=Scomber scombrus TaxID=13677 RepID=A0AAV1QE76_SCOSC
MKTENKLFLLIIILSFSATDNNDSSIICPTDPVKAKVGQNVTLDFHLEPPRDVTDDTVEWKFNGKQYVVLYKQKDESEVDKARLFKGRVTFNKTALHKGILTVNISSVNSFYDGNYTCSVGHGPGSKSCTVRLIVENPDNGSSLDSTNKQQTCPVTPGKFNETPSVEAELGKDIILPCYPKFNISMEDDMVEWSKGGAGICTFEKVRNKTYEGKYKDRLSFDFGKIKTGNASIKLSRVEKSDEGEYCCCIIRDKEINCTSVTLDIYSFWKTTGGYFTIGAIIGAIVGAVVGFLIWWKCRPQDSKADETVIPLNTTGASDEDAKPTTSNNPAGQQTKPRRTPKKSQKPKKRRP